jgi:hypothetical protein
MIPIIALEIYTNEQLVQTKNLETVVDQLDTHTLEYKHGRLADPAKV